MSETQLQLLPDQPWEPLELRIPLACLPEDRYLLGLDPDPSFCGIVRATGVQASIWLIPDKPFLPSADLSPADLIEYCHEFRWTIADGLRRVKASRLAGFPFIPAKVFPHGVTPKGVLTLMGNAHRKANPAAELDAIESLLGTNFNEKDIAGLLKLDLNLVRKRLKLRALVTPLRDAFNEGKIAVSVAEEACKLDDARQERLARVLETEGKITQEHVSQVQQTGVHAALTRINKSIFGDGEEDEGEETGADAFDGEDDETDRAIRDAAHAPFQSEIPEHLRGQRDGELRCGHSVDSFVLIPPAGSACRDCVAQLLAEEDSQDLSAPITRTEQVIGHLRAALEVLGTDAGKLTKKQRLIRGGLREVLRLAGGAEDEGETDA